MFKHKSQSQHEIVDTQQTSFVGQNSNGVNQNQVNSPSLFPLHTVLQMGSHGSLVSLLQQSLLRLGLQIVVDGVFGAQTEKIVRMFQRLQKMDIDGVAGNETLQRLSNLVGGNGTSNSTGNQGETQSGTTTSEHSNSESKSAPSTMVEHRVFPGESLWGIAQQYYKNGARWREIAQANGLSDASVIHVGQVLQIPGIQNPSSSNQKETPNSPSSGQSTGSSSGSVSTSDPNSASKAPSTQTTSTTEHRVFPGESLWEIAQQYYKNGARWREIARANGLSDASVLQVGQVLLIPNAPSSSSSSGTTQNTTSNSETSQSATSSSTPSTSQSSATSSGGLGASDPISLAGLSGLRFSMAKIYNEKGAYLQQKANQLGISSSAAAAVLHIESGGSGFSNSGKMIVRFENHIFWDQWGASHPEKFAEHFALSSGQRWTGHKFRQNKNAPFETFHGNQSKEWEVLELARSLSDTAALKSISMGIAQIMGFNHKGIGYDSVQEMFDAMSNGLPAQLDGMFTFIQKNSRCMRGLKNNDYVLFASAYNGSGQAATYGGLISSAANVYKSITAGRSHV